ncbi:MAG: preprotein translocase subunit SecG [Gammaproteobacteria bacterium]|nr:preprotein translocase subunit SecG [Gammaproteobacteria bacterium]
MLHTIILITHMFLALCMIGLILLQRGKGADAGAAFGAGASGTVFGASGSANFLSRTTAVLATLFFVTSLSLAFLGAQPTQPRSLLEEAPVAGDQERGEPSEPSLTPAPDVEDELPPLPGTETPVEAPAADEPSERP